MIRTFFTPQDITKYLLSQENVSLMSEIFSRISEKSIEQTHAYRILVDKKGN